MVAHACNSSTMEAEVEGSRVRGQPGLSSRQVTKKSNRRLLIKMGQTLWHSGEEGKEKRMIESQQYQSALHLCR
jgi:hypothetical protein